MTLNVFNTVSFLETAGYIGLFIIIFAETSVFIGFFLPGDSLLFTAGLLSSIGYFHIVTIIIIAFIAAVLGDNVGYAVGRKYGSKIFRRQNSLLLDKEYISKAESFYNRHGGKTIIIARFLPVVRTAAPVLAGVGKMRYGIFLMFNLVGAILWTVSLNLLGYYLGKTFPKADRYIIEIIVLIVVVSIAPTAWAILKSAERRRQILISIKEKIKRR